MPRPFDPVRMLKDLSTDLLCELFTREGARLKLQPDDLSKHENTPIVKLWETLDESQRWRIHIVLQDVHSLACEGGLRVLAEQLEWLSPEHNAEFTKWESWPDKVLWAYLHTPETFDEASVFAQADTLISSRYWNRWNGLPTRRITVTERHTRALQDELCDYYWPRELRGRHCRVHHYPRGRGVDYFFAYLDDWPDKQLTFDDDGHIEPRSDRYAFSNVFAYDPDNGRIDLVAKGGRKVHLRLRQAFCRAVLDTEVEDAAPMLPAYHLDHLLDPHLSLPTAAQDQISKVRITKIRIAPQHVENNVRYEEIGFSQSASLDTVRAWIRERRTDEQSTSELAEVIRIAFQLQFVNDGRSRPRTMTFNVSSPNSCDLKGKSNELRAIGERCLKLWGINRD